jgi:hypothetical protein
MDCDLSAPRFRNNRLRKPFAHLSHGGYDPASGVIVPEGAIQLLLPKLRRRTSVLVMVTLTSAELCALII